MEFETESGVEEHAPSDIGVAVTTDRGAVPQAESLESQLAAAKKLAQDSHEKYLYAMAEFENYKKRMERTLADRLVAGKKSTLGKFLPVIDNLERAMSFDQDSEGLRGGLQATLRGFEALLASEDVTTFAVLHAPFNPHNAEAIGTKETSEHADDVVVEEVQRGYKIGDDLLRPARVIVAKSALVEPAE
jgi:molecular chaperone GrpE